MKKYETEIGGKSLSVEFGKLAQQASGSCYVRYGDSAVLVTATMSDKPKDAGYFPLSVEYEEKYYAAGKIKGSKWIKRETRPSEEAILSARVIDRTLRPRFDHRIRNEVQIVATVLSFDGVNDPDIPSIIGASLSLMVSDIPFDGPVAGVRVGKEDGKFIFNPTYDQRNSSEFDVVVAGTAEKINMIEAGGAEIKEKEMADAIMSGFDEVKKLIDFQNKVASDFKVEKRKLEVDEEDPELVEFVRSFASPKLEKIIYAPNKMEYIEGSHTLESELMVEVENKYKDRADLGKKLRQASAIFEEEIDRIVHKNILESDKRPDGRKLDEVRNIWVETGILPYSHGVGLFNRGTTQALTILTLAAPGMEQWIETMEIALTKKRFMHHYVFPPFSVGETGRIGGAGRRDIGHGALAEKALRPLIPDKEKFPYTIRVVSEILSSNGSSSMASVCGSTLALMDGGVPIKSPAAGIAMGLIMDDKGKNHKVLTDIQGPEDHHGDMDLKVAGTKEGITAMQMDVKVDGITKDILEKSLEQAKKARLEILDVMLKTISEPRKELSKLAPRIEILKIDPDKIGALIGPGGKMINEIIEKTGVEIDIEDDGSVFVTAPNGNGEMEQAIKLIKNVTYEPKAGDEFEGKVVKIMDFGAFVEIMPGKDGMVHVSEISDKHVKHPSDVLKVGQKVKVTVKKIDEYGRINLTMK
ncbi:MAG: polyribonucleotide nucleotidyltransferase [Candidatus Yanofskybacteria bacterium CG10_big_fil_rev_8_21_14_0_10_36_16]|uniref:Polyribonucleotide nucleotidyltransferase n=1 Tax=Candidatus Yanofskybacteria bacterium CG10_big_fil_rev_8_21_14_0_10_36_16 TaxID=1975096 RepID=A0A2J0Q7Y1_9BACT|nr:MAG: polyribonucleotide nucleotidyltransferase [Candidatus Yanofskybacteria bacterium CG10_big_fil_rev_8_21_14_0_10_36_16]